MDTVTVNKITMNRCRQDAAAQMLDPVCSCCCSKAIREARQRWCMKHVQQSKQSSETAI